MKTTKLGSKFTYHRGIKKRNEGINLRLEYIVFDREELSFVIEIKNAAPRDYELNFLNLSVETRKNGKKKSIQRSSWNRFLNTTCKALFWRLKRRYLFMCCKIFLIAGVK